MDLYRLVLKISDTIHGEQGLRTLHKNKRKPIDKENLQLNHKDKDYRHTTKPAEETRKDLVVLGWNHQRCEIQRCFELRRTNPMASRKKKQVKRHEHLDRGRRRNLSERMKKFWVEKNGLLIWSIVSHPPEYAKLLNIPALNNNTSTAITVWMFENLQYKI